MSKGINEYNNIFFIGIAGVGMSAIAQYLAGTGITVSGSDRYFRENEYNETRAKLEAEGINCFLQNGDGITEQSDLVVVSTAIEDMVYEVEKARKAGIPVLLRSDVLALIAKSKRTIHMAVTISRQQQSLLFLPLDSGRVRQEP